jgi:hypothetical protein
LLNGIGERYTGSGPANLAHLSWFKELGPAVSPDALVDPLLANPLGFRNRRASG